MKACENSSECNSLTILREESPMNPFFSKPSILLRCFLVTLIECRKFVPIDLESVKLPTKDQSIYSQKKYIYIKPKNRKFG